MTATRKDIHGWLVQADALGATHLIVAVDHFDYENYPVYVMPGESVIQVVEMKRSESMQSVDEVYSLTGNHSIEAQLNEFRAYYLD